MDNYQKLQDTLKEVFEMDKADLDFGIYRIMNQKREQVMDFIDRQLPKDIKTILVETQAGNQQQLQEQLNKLGKSLDDAGVLRESSPRYQDLFSQINQQDSVALEQEVFSHLANFFKRYYKEGDFISMRRYKKDVYAIPYEGEEVKLHWANHDQYYIKTSEYLKNYAFKLSNGKKVHFQLKEASTEQNNNKTQGDIERRFAIYGELPLEVIGEELYVNFTYEPLKKAVKQEDFQKEALKIIAENIPAEFANAFDKAPTEKNKSRTLLEKHLNDFISRNTFDYFIHKDLGGFLRRELDFYIKNEVLFIDDINTESPALFTAQLSKIKALKTVADKIIAFLSQVEDFQKKLWLKKKFVISTDYCITMDRIPVKYYQEIISNSNQLSEWETLFNVTIRSLGDLSEEPYLVLDTKNFSEDFKDKILAEFDKLHEETDGLLINSENFQALNLMQEAFSDSIKAIYIDPPYNTSASEIVYKNEYRNSSWIQLMADRVNLGHSLLNELGVQCTTIDDVQLTELSMLLESVFKKGVNAGIVPILINPSGRPVDKGFALCHEYGLFFKKTSQAAISKIRRSEKQMARFNEKDEISVFEYRNLRREGSNSDRKDGERQFFAIYGDVHSGTIRIPESIWVEEKREWNILEKPLDNETIIFPINDDGNEKNWRWSIDSIKEDYTQFLCRIPKYGTPQVYYRYRPNMQGVTPLSLWTDTKFSATEQGTKVLKDLFKQPQFSYPKSIFAVVESLKVMGVKGGNIILDYFAGSGTTGHATIKLNREDEGKRKYILVEMGTYFNTVTKPRIQKVIYSDNWKRSAPQDKIGISQIFKYQLLESYEDTLNNLQLASLSSSNSMLKFNQQAQEEYVLDYMLDVETRDHLFNIQMFRNPFNYQLKVTENNELVLKKVDLVETFNYLIGLYVDRMQRVKDIKLVEGTTRKGVKTLVIWRNIETTNNDETERVFRKLYDSTRTSEFQQIYLNGDHNFENVRQGEDSFKVKMIEDTFFKKMFNISEL